MPSERKKILYSFDRFSFDVFVIFLSLVITTIASIRLFYGAFYFSRWPWLKFSFLLSLLTCLWPFAYQLVNIFEIKRNNIVKGDYFNLVIVPIEILVLYPGPKLLGLESDSDFIYLLGMISLIHGIGFFFLRKGILKYLGDYYIEQKKKMEIENKVL